jgi:tRNA G46 methylase TrmB
LIACHERTTVDLGAGDGSSVLWAARKDSRALAIGVDTDAAGFREASRRAAMSARKGGLPNALFVVADASEAMAALRGSVAELKITLPWGSLFRTVLEGEEAFADAVAGSL